MIIIGFDVEKQVVQKRKNCERLVNDSSNYLKLCFNFKESTWDNLTKRVLVSSKHSKVYCKELDENDECIVPWEVLTENYFMITLYGTGENDTRVTTTQKKIFLENSGFLKEMDKDLQPNKSIVEDIYDRLNNTVEMEVIYGDDSSETFNVVVK